MRSLELDFQEAVECELKRRVLFFTHRVSPSVAGSSRREPARIRARPVVRWVRYHGDIGNPGWEWSGTGLRPVDDTNEAYKLGVNYIIYGLTH